MKKQEWMMPWVSLVHAGQYLPAQLSAHLQEQLGVSLAEQDLLNTLRKSGSPLTMTELAEQLFLTRSAMTKMVDRLESSGQIRRQRSASDRRVIRVRLTARGRVLVDASRPMLEDWVEANLKAHLSSKQMRALGESLQAVLSGHDRWEDQVRHVTPAPKD